MENRVRLNDLGSAAYWQSLLPDSGEFDLTFVLPTGRAVKSVTPHLALSTDGLLLPEISLVLARHVREGCHRDIRVRTLLDIDFWEEFRAQGSIDSNVIVIGSADVSLAAGSLLDETRSFDDYGVGFSRPYENPTIIGAKGTRYMFTVSPNTGVLALYSSCWSSRDRIAIHCAGLFAVGTIAAERLLLSYLEGEGDGNNRFAPEVPVKIVDGVPTKYFHVGLKPMSDYFPAMEVVNISGVNIRE
jgi:hypothetical protein